MISTKYVPSCHSLHCLNEKKYGYNSKFDSRFTCAKNIPRDFVFANMNEQTHLCKNTPRDFVFGAHESTTYSLVQVYLAMHPGRISRTDNLFMPAFE